MPIKVVLPAVLTVLLFVTTIFLLILPRLESNLMDRKREMIQELTETAWSALGVFEEKARSGLMSHEEAQHQALENLRNLRYGPEGKDYFWINDMHPRLIMHPYRLDLEGRDISNFTDPKGKRLFIEFVRTVKAHGAGYVDYEWQWKDDPDRIVPKISYVKGFQPWGWIVGTGIYIEDVRAEIALITRRLTLICLGILAMILSLSAYIVWQGVGAEKQAKLQQEQLFQASKLASLGTLVSGVAHEINNPIMSVMLNAPILRKAWEGILPILDAHFRDNGDFMVNNMNYTLLRERIPILLADIHEAAQRVKGIVSDLKDFARQSPSEKADMVDINLVVKKSIGLAGNLIKKSTADFSVHYQPDLPTFRGNAQRIEQVVINLLVNACQAVSESQRPIRVSTGSDSKLNAVTVQVRDEGGGMSQDVLRRIKDPFFTTKREFGGTGLGLSISDKIVCDHGGSLTFSSIPGGGTTVQVSLPLQTGLTAH